MSDARARLIYGTSEAPPPPHHLTAGALSAMLEDGNLRTVRFDGVEVIRAVSFLVRSRAWTTLAPAISDLVVEQTADAFTIAYTARVQDGDATLDYVARIRGEAGGRLAFECTATAVTAFETCRTGFVVLHPLFGVAGNHVRIAHADGSVEDGRFPALIDPVQPLRNLRALTHTPVPGLTVTCRMEGDTFEMEDQRNWTDASLKTYVRPLALPWPYTLAAGERLVQRVTLNCAGRPARQAHGDGAILLDIGPPLGAMPPLALGCTPTEATAALAHLPTLRAAGIPALVCRFDPRLGHGAADLARCRDLAAGIGAGVELQLVVPSLHAYAADLAAAAEVVEAVGLTPSAIMVVPAADMVSTPPGSPWPPCPPLDAVYRAARAAFPGVRLGGGMFTHFTELNRKRPPLDLIDFVTFATTAIVHAADDRSVMETIEALPDLAASAHAVAAGLPFVVGPSAIGMRDNPNGPGPLPNPELKRLPMAAADPRQRGLFNAAWTLGFVAAFAAGGAARIAVSAPAGDFGILDADGVWPVFHVLRVAASLQGGEVRAVHGVRGTALAGLDVRCGGVSHLLLANLGNAAQTAALPASFIGAGLRVLDAAALLRGARTADAFTASPASAAPASVTLDAYAVAWLRAD